MAATPKPIRREAKKIESGLRKVDKSHPSLMAHRKEHGGKKSRRDFSKHVAKLRAGKK